MILDRVYRVCSNLASLELSVKCLTCIFIEIRRGDGNLFLSQNFLINF